MEAKAIKKEPGFRRLMDQITRRLNYVGITALMIMMLVSVVDVCGRFFFNLPLPGTYEIVQYAMIATVFFCFGHIQVVGGNISVEIVVSRMPGRVQAIFDLVTTIIATAMFVCFAWASVLQMQHLNSAGSMSGVLSIPDWPFGVVVAFGYAMLTLVLISDIMLIVLRLLDGDFSAYEATKATEAELEKVLSEA